MGYTYSQQNRLVQPHNYMYTPFEGVGLLEGFFESRARIVRRHPDDRADPQPADRELSRRAAVALEHWVAASGLRARADWVALAGGDDATSADIDREAKLLELAALVAAVEPTSAVATLELLRSLIAAQLSGSHRSATRAWLDRVIQRFEVTKRLYASYLPGFRKGEGDHLSLRLYWLFALALCLGYAESRNLKLLSALLKVCDLLCSVDEAAVRREVSDMGLRLVLATETAFVRRLATSKGVSIAVA